MPSSTPSSSTPPTSTPSSSTPPASTPAGPPDTGRDSTRQNPTRREDAAALTALLRRLHFHAGVLVAPFLFVAALSGLLYAVSPMTDTWLHHDLLIASSPDQAVPASQQVATAERAVPALQASGIVMPAPGRTTMVLFDDPHLAPEQHRAAFVDPADGHLHGTSVVQGSTWALPERAWVDQLHDNLHLGQPGRLYSELAASWLAPITLAGLWLWWRRRRSLPASGTSPRNRARRTHTRLGVAACLGLLFLSATGLTWSKHAGAHVDALRQELHWTTPTVSTALDGANASASHGHDHGAMEGMDMGDGNPAAASGTGRRATSNHLMPGQVMSLDPDAVDLVVASAHANLRAPYLVGVGRAGQAWTAKETRHSWTIGPDAVAIAPSTGIVVDRRPFASFPVAAKLTDWGIRLHMGFLFGTLNQLLLAALAASLLVVIVQGYRMWWLRRPTRHDGPALGRPPARGAL